jgi:hypothetical protein
MRGNNVSDLGIVFVQICWRRISAFNCLMMS